MKASLSRTNSDGWTLIDTMVATLFAAMLAAVLHSFAVLAVETIQTRKVADDLDETARIALDFMVRDVREAGYGLPNGGTVGLTTTTADEIALARDLDLDGSTDSANERVGYAFDATSRRLTRRLGNAPPQPMVDHISAVDSGFRYFDANDRELSAEQLETPAVRAEVKQVEITITLSAHTNYGWGRLPSTRHQTRVALRNRN